MAAPDAETGGNSIRTADFWDPAKNKLHGEIWEDIRTLDGYEEFFGRTLPALARHFDGKALDELRQANPWLAVFEPSSAHDWKEAKDAFLDNGPACLDVLASFTDLTRLEALIIALLRLDGSLCTALLLCMRHELELLDKYLSEQDIARSTMGVFGADELEGISPSRLEALRDKYSAEEKATKFFLGSHSLHMAWLACRILFQWLWDVQPKNRNSTSMRNVVEFHARSMVERSRNVERTDIHQKYKAKVQSFVHQVGCAKVHVEPEANIAELRLFHSVTIGYFAKLQDQYIKKELEAKKLRHHISALEFRHLLEKLAPPWQPGTRSDPGSGPRWMKFWEDALEDENYQCSERPAWASQHALKGIVDARNPKRVQVDPSTGARAISKTGQNGQVFRTGNDLYGTLSDEIHRFRGREFVVEDDDGWTRLVTETLRALRPLEEHIDTATGEVDWAAERERFLMPDPFFTELPYFDEDDLSAV